MGERAPIQAPVPARWRSLVAWAGTLAYMAVLWWFSSRSAPVVSRWNFLRLPDYVLHAAAYLGLSVVAHWAWAAGFRSSFLRTACAAVLLASAYGIVDEWHQSFVPGREPSWRDVAADVLGAVLGQFVLWVWPSAQARQDGGQPEGQHEGQHEGPPEGQHEGQHEGRHKGRHGGQHAASAGGAREAGDRNEAANERISE